MTTGTPPTDDRGAAVLADCASAIKSATNLPIQGQCEPPSDFGWFARMRQAGVDSLGMHLEAWDENVRRRIMPGKAEVTRAFYLEAFTAAVEIFGRGQVSTYLLAGLGDTVQSLHEGARSTHRSRRVSVYRAFRTGDRHSTGDASTAVAGVPAERPRSGGSMVERGRNDFRYREGRLREMRSLLDTFHL